ncbi:MAG: phasin family protein [Acidimicrobiia bacterium]|nr:phasin family protein [Acidimicrobiia bacterium]MCL4292996.1 phasin family protein [Acidimicrobiia bacterium]
MAQGSDLKEYLDAGVQFVAQTRAEARRRARDLVKQGYLAQEQLQSFVDGVMEQSRARTDELAEVVRKEIQRQVKALGIATRNDLDRLEAKIDRKLAGGAKKSPARKAPAKAAARKSAARKAAPRKAAPRKASGGSS